jgi:hypothetical protein
MKSLFLIVIAIATCFSLYAASDSRNGVWTAELQGDSLQMTLFRGNNMFDGRGRGMSNIMGFEEPLGTFAGLSRADLAAAAANVQFETRRPAGTIAYDGRFSSGTGAGHFRFTPSDDFIHEMETLGYRGFTDDQLLVFAAYDFSPQTIRDLRALGYQPTQREVEEIAIFRITAEAVREYGRLGYSNLSLRELVNFRVGRVDAAYINGMRELGFTNISARQLSEMAILGVTPAYVRELRAAGLGDLSTRTWIDLRVGNITSKKIQEYAKAGYANLTTRELIDFGIHGVTPKFIEELRALGYDKLTPRQLIDMRIFGVTPEYIRKINTQGYQGVPLEKLMKLRMSGADEILFRK